MGIKQDLRAKGQNVPLCKDAYDEIARLENEIDTLSKSGFLGELTLRDYFAAQIIALTSGATGEIRAISAYALADEMVKVR